MGQPRSQNGHPGHTVAEDQLELDTAFQGDTLKAICNLFTRDLKALQLPFQAGQKNAGLKVGVLVEVENVATVAKDEVGDSGNQSAPVWTGDDQFGCVAHRKNSWSGGSWKWYLSVLGHSLPKMTQSSLLLDLSVIG